MLQRLNPDREGEHKSFDNRIAYASNMYLAIMSKYCTKSNIDTKAKIIDYHRVRSGFTSHGDNTVRADDHWNSYSHLGNVTNTIRNFIRLWNC